MSGDVSPPPLKRRRLSPRTPSSNVAANLPTLPTCPTPILTKPYVLRIYSWNVNGINPLLPPQSTKITDFLSSSPIQKAKDFSQSKQPSLRACLQRWQWPQILCLQEVKIAPSDTKTQAAVQRAVNGLPDLGNSDESDGVRHVYDAHFCLPRDKHNATGFGGKVYGVAIIVRRDLSDVQTKSVDWDLEGRVLLAEVFALGIVVFNIYAVNGTTNDYRDPETGKFIGNRHDRKRQFHTSLENEVQRYEARGWRVVVAGDINISRTRIDSFPQLRMGEEHVQNRADFEAKIIQGAGMIDTFRFLQGEQRKYSYRPRNKTWGDGGDRVDMVLVSQGLKDAVEKADILDNEEERGPSDHVPLMLQMMIK
ncbi:hypothetical protein MMC21_005832 [Puttea exsequens]|nr:hypothetical protein [Puttea exsequens]